MKWLLVALAVLLASVAVALVALPDPGYVLIGYGNYSIETTLIVFVVLLVLVYFGLRLLAGLWQVPRKVHHWEQRRRARRLQRLFDESVIELLEGRPQRAERRLARLLKSGQAPLQAYLSAAKLASQAGADDRRDRYLELATRRFPTATVAVEMTRAELQLARSQLDQAQTTLEQLQKQAPHSARTLQLRMQLYLKQQDWEQLRALLPDLLHAGVLESERWQQLAAQVYREQVRALGDAGDEAGLKGAWKQLPPPVRQDEGLLAVYVEQLLHLGEQRQAERLLQQRIADHWSPRLVYLYGELDGADAAHQLETAERWLEQHPDDAVLLLTLGKISLRNQLWGKARGYLEASISRQPTPEACRLLGSLLERLEEPEKAAECYRKGLELTGPTLTDAMLPAPAEERAAGDESDAKTEDSRSADSA
ncbi:MAG TPA: heme biosynthesis protein HemY [Gammaproteobacteria bacterium]|nr:heme biosynthesis protein HemY [Gammaproteobacteria bacterium]